MARKSEDRAQYEIDLNDLFSRKLNQASKNYDAFDKKVKGTGLVNFKGISPLTIGLGAAVAGMGLLIKKSSQLGAAFEQTRISYQVMVGSAKGGNQLLAQLKDYANVTPYIFSDVSDAGKLLLNYGVSANKILPTVKMLGDVAAGDANKLHLLSLAYSQVQATGRLMGQDLLQLVNSGFNPLKIISEKTGLSMGVLKKKMEDGAISARDVEKAFKIATSEGGLFHDMTKKQAETFEGQWSTMIDKLEAKMTNFGEFFNRAMMPGLKAINATLDKMDKSKGTNEAESFKKNFADHEKVLGLYQQLNEYKGYNNKQANGLRQTLEKEFLNEFPQFAKKFVNGEAVGINGGKVQDYLKSFGGTTRNKVREQLDKEIDQKGYMIENLGKVLADRSSTMTASEVQSAQASIMEFVNEQKELVKMRKSLNISGPGKGFLSSALTANDTFDLQKKGAGKTDKVDGEVRSGGIKNIVINITQLVGEITFESLNKLSENQVIEVVKRALLTAVNDANLAIP